MDLLDGTVEEWITYLLQEEASETYATKIQTQVTALKAKLASQTKEVPVNLALKTSGSANKHIHDDSKIVYFNSHIISTNVFN